MQTNVLPALPPELPVELTDELLSPPSSPPPQAASKERAAIVANNPILFLRKVLMNMCLLPFLPATDGAEFESNSVDYAASWPDG